MSLCAISSRLSLQELLVAWLPLRLVLPYRPIEAAAAIIGGSVQRTLSIAQYFAVGKRAICLPKAVQQSELAFRAQLPHGSVVAGSTARKGIAIQITLRVTHNACGWIAPVRSASGKVVQDGLAALLTHPPYNPVAGGAALEGVPIEVPGLVHRYRPHGIAAIRGASGKAVQHGQGPSLAQLVQHSVIFGGAALVRHAI